MQRHARTLKARGCKAALTLVAGLSLLQACVSGPGRRSDRSCPKALNPAELRYFPEHHLPFPKPQSYYVSGEPANSFSHDGKGKYAWDIVTVDGGRGARLVAGIDGCVRAVKRDATARYGSKSAANNVNYVVLSWPQAIADRYRYGAKVESLFLHLESVDPSIYPGKCVRRGDPVGIAGCTGWCTGIHLHYQVQLREPSGSWWGQSIAIGFAERTLPYRGVMATSTNAPLTAPAPDEDPDPVAPLPGDTANGGSTVDLDFACAEVGGSTPQCLSRVVGFADRRELIHCKSRRVDLCSDSCEVSEAISGDRCAGSLVNPDAAVPPDNDGQIPPADLEQVRDGESSC